MDRWNFPSNRGNNEANYVTMLERIIFNVYHLKSFVKIKLIYYLSMITCLDKLCNIYIYIALLQTMYVVYFIVMTSIHTIKRAN